MTVTLTEEYVRQRLGSPGEIAARNERLRNSAKVLSSNTPRLIDQFHKRWVAVVDGEVKVTAPTFTALQQEVESQRLNELEKQLIVRYIDRHRRTLIL